MGRKRKSENIQGEIDKLIATKAEWQVEYEALLDQMSENLSKNGEFDKLSKQRRDIEDRLAAADMKIARLTTELAGAVLHETKVAFTEWCKPYPKLLEESQALAAEIEALEARVKEIKEKRAIILSQVGEKSRYVGDWISRRVVDPAIGDPEQFVEIAQSFGINNAHHYARK